MFFNCSSWAGLSWLKLLQGESLVRQVDHCDIVSCFVVVVVLFFPLYHGLLFFFYWGEECKGPELAVGFIDNLCWVCAPARDCIAFYNMNRCRLVPVVVGFES